MLSCYQYTSHEIANSGSGVIANTTICRIAHSAPATHHRHLRFPKTKSATRVENRCFLLFQKRKTKTMGNPRFNGKYQHTIGNSWFFNSKEPQGNPFFQHNMETRTTRNNTYLRSKPYNIHVQINIFIERTTTLAGNVFCVE